MSRYLSKGRCIVIPSPPGTHTPSYVTQQCPIVASGLRGNFTFSCGNCEPESSEHVKTFRRSYIVEGVWSVIAQPRKWMTHFCLCRLVGVLPERRYSGYVFWNCDEFGGVVDLRHSDIATQPPSLQNVFAEESEIGIWQTNRHSRSHVNSGNSWYHFSGLD